MSENLNIDDVAELAAGMTFAHKIEPTRRAGRWIGISKCAGECGIHIRSLKTAVPPR